MKFAGERGEELQVKAGEVTYVNHIPEGELWNSFSDLSNVFVDWSVAPRNAGSIEGVSSVLTFKGSQDGTPFVSAGHYMNVEVKAALRAYDKSKVLVLQLVNRGSLDSGNFDEISSWLGTASADVVKGFTELTSPVAHRFWGRKS